MITSINLKSRNIIYCLVKRMKRNKYINKKVQKQQNFIFSHTAQNL